MRAFLLTGLLAITVFSSTTYAEPPPASAEPYYGQAFYNETLGKKHDQELVKALRAILSGKHLRKQGAFDTIVESCDSAARSCYSQIPVGYKTARKLVLNQLHLSENPARPGIEEVYCQKDYTSDDFGTEVGPGTAALPSDRVINVEHTWPQSKFNRQMNADMQKSDLHHLFPTNSEMNRIRGHLKFGEVVKPAYPLPCPASKMGAIDGKSGDYFEPPQNHKGNVARALFYFSVRYQLPIDPEEEAFLKAWNKEDPVDEEESERNAQIQKIQGNRNPFVDFPELADFISNF